MEWSALGDGAFQRTAHSQRWSTFAGTNRNSAETARTWQKSKDRLHEGTGHGPSNSLPRYSLKHGLSQVRTLQSTSWHPSRFLLAGFPKQLLERSELNQGQSLGPLVVFPKAVPWPCNVVPRTVFSGYPRQAQSPHSPHRDSKAPLLGTAP